MRAEFELCAAVGVVSDAALPEHTQRTFPLPRSLPWANTSEETVKRLSRKCPWKYNTAQRESRWLTALQIQRERKVCIFSASHTITLFKDILDHWSQPGTSDTTGVLWPLHFTTSQCGAHRQHDQSDNYRSQVSCHNWHKSKVNVDEKHKIQSLLNIQRSHTWADNLWGQKAGPHVASNSGCPSLL